MTANATLPATGFGFSWVLDEGKELITKTVAPDFVFVDYETFINTNVCHRLRKRSIDSYVSITAPLGLLATIYGWEDTLRLVGTPEGEPAIQRSCDYVSTSMEQASDAGADAIILCDDLCGEKAPVIDPRLVLETLVPLYGRFAAKACALGLPLIFHSKGDIREYYPALAEAGFAGIHIAHPSPSVVGELFAEARKHGLLPFGGLLSSQIDSGAQALADFAIAQAKEGPALICDDGATKDAEKFKVFVDALCIARTAVPASSDGIDSDGAASDGAASGAASDSASSDEAVSGAASDGSQPSGTESPVEP